MNHKLLPVLLAALFSACAAQPTRTIASAPDSQSVELASKLNGGELKFRAYRDDNGVSLLGFLRMKFKNCTAVVQGESDPIRPEFRMDGSYVLCDVDLDTDPLRSSFKIRVQGDKRDFVLQANTELNNDYALDLNVHVTYADRQWKGQGKVYGWINKKIGNRSSVTATVRETIDF